VLREGRIAAMGEASRVQPPAGATIVDLTGKTVVPGLVMLQHLYYPVGPGVYGQLGQASPPLPRRWRHHAQDREHDSFMDLNLKRAIDDGRVAGPAMDATAPCERRQHVPADAVDGERGRGPTRWRAGPHGATSFKAYMQISRAELAAVIDEAHRRGLKVTAHLCSVTYAEAADLGIDNLEHGFFAATDFVQDKQPDVCPGQARAQQSLAPVNESSPEFQALVRRLVGREWRSRPRSRCSRR
jgi:enamidase